MKKAISMITAMALAAVTAAAMTACTDKNSEESTFDKFAKDWRAYKMTTVTDGVESAPFENFQIVNPESTNFVRFYFKKDRQEDGYGGWFQERIRNTQSGGKKYSINFQGLDFVWKLENDSVAFHVQGNTADPMNTEQKSIDSDFTASFSGEWLIVEQELTENVSNRFYCKAD